MRIIDVDALIEKLGIAKECNDCEHDEEPYCRWKPDVVDICEAINDTPTIEPERKTGKWIPVDSFSAFGGDEATWMAHGNPIAFYYCSECREQAYAGEDGESLLTKFCPNCGAKLLT